MLKDKLRHTKNFKSSFEQKSIEIGKHQTASGYEHSINKNVGRDYREKVDTK